MNGGTGGTVRYLARHSLFRVIGAGLGAMLRVAGLGVLALLGVAVWCLVHWPTVTVLVVLWLYWRRRRRLAYRARVVVDPVKVERERLAVELLRARVMAAHAKLDPDLIAAERDYREGRISRLDYDTAVAHAADRAREEATVRRSGFRFH